MSTTEIILWAILWIITGLFISHKRRWYEYAAAGDTVFFVTFNIIFALFRVFFWDKWEDF